MNAGDAYDEVLRITRREARNFAWGIRILPADKQRAVAALYAFAREVDDLADRPRPAKTDLEAWRRAVSDLASAGASPITVALSDAVARYEIPTHALVDLVDGALMDCERNRYASWSELEEYCSRVAGAVGVACAAIYGPTDPVRGAERARTLGLALQQINIMRDVPEDWTLGRVYLPEDELRRFGVSEDDIATGRVGPEWRALMEHQGARAEDLMRRGLELLPLLDRRSALCVRTFAGIYRGLLTQMRARDFDVFTTRPALSAVGKLRAVAAL